MTFAPMLAVRGRCFAILELRAYWSPATIRVAGLRLRERVE
jgi:hypothetical protein